MPSTDPWGARGCPEARRATGTLGPGRSPSRQGREAPPCMPDVASATDSLECRFDSVAAVCEEAGRCHQNTSAKARNAHWMSEMLSCLMSTNANTTVCLVVHGRETPGFYTQDNCERRHTAMLTPWAPTVYACMCSRYACTCIGSYRCVYSLHGRERRCLHARLRLARARIAGVAMALAALCHHCLEDSVAALTLAVLDGILPRDVCLG